MIRQRKKLSKYLLFSALLHVFIALAISRIYAQQPQPYKTLRIIGTVKIQYKEPEKPPPPKPKVMAKNEPTKKEVPKKKEIPRPKPQKVIPPKVVQKEQSVNAPAQGQSPERAVVQDRASSGVPGLKGTLGAPGDQPGMRASGGIPNARLETKIGGQGLTPGLTHGSMSLPSGTGTLPGAGGKDLAGFRMGSSVSGTGVGQIDMPGRGGRGGTGGRADEGPGAGLATTGRTGIGGGTGTTGIGVGSTQGMGKVDSDPGGKGTGGGGGPGTGAFGAGGYGPTGAGSNPGIVNRAGDRVKNAQDLPTRSEIPEEKRSGALGKKEFQAEVGKSLNPSSQPIEEPANRGYENALQGEINKDLYSLRKIHEDWVNLNIPNIPKALQITVELDTVNNRPKILKVDFHNPSLSQKIVDDLTSKIRSWKFESLFDGKDDPQKWPIKLSGKISWQ